MRFRLDDLEPIIADDVFIAPGAAVIGDVVLGAGASVWFSAVLRGDVYPIRVGARTNIQDGAVVHVTNDRHATTLEHDVTVGHRAVVHGCFVEHHCLIGMGSVVMDGARVGAYSIVGAGALVPPGMQIPSGVLAVGSPARVKRPLTDEERAWIDYSAQHYHALGARYLTALAPAR
jgi:carbonic anhydrase/acetyltransferase-like protein (isoleucine patch superfamily)